MYKLDSRIFEKCNNSIDKDGTGQGYLFEILDLLPHQISMPVILAGGAGKYHHLLDGLRDNRVDAVATAHLFNFVGNGLKTARDALLSNGCNLAKWNSSIAAKYKNILLNNVKE